MNPVAAIALLALRQTLRSRVVLALLALLLSRVVGRGGRER